MEAAIPYIRNDTRNKASADNSKLHGFPFG
jgi:hypothetical protein